MPPTTFQELSKVGPPNCTYIEINSRPGGENHKGSVDFWRREKPVFAEVSKLFATIVFMCLKLCSAQHKMNGFVLDVFNAFDVFNGSSLKPQVCPAPG